MGHLRSGEADTLDGSAAARRDGPRVGRGCAEEDPVLCAVPGGDPAGPATG